MINVLKIVISIAAMATGTPANAQEIDPAAAGALAAGVVQQGGEILREAPGQLDGLLDDAADGRQFETEASCLAHLQLAAQFAALVRNTMPFSNAWTLEDARGPVVKLRMMLAGERNHVELHCDGAAMTADRLPWGEGSSEPRLVEASTLDAALGALFVLNAEGAFDTEEQVVPTESLPTLPPEAPMSGSATPATGLE